MKQVIEELEKAEKEVSSISLYGNTRRNREKLDEAIGLIQGAITKLQETPRRETPEQWEKRTGEEWPDDWAVYALYETAAGEERFWAANEYCYARDGVSKCIVCATEAGKPPDGWEPEEE
jgi:hypothetical protein